MKYQDISPKELMESQTKAMWNDIDMLLSFKEQFVHVPCPACQVDRPVSRYEKYGMSHVECPECHTQYITPRPTPEILKHFYSNSKNYEYYAKFIFPATAEKRREKIFKPRAARIAEFCRSEGCGTNLLVEIGIGYGFFCEELNKLGLFRKVLGVEPTPHLAEICRQKGIEVIEDLVENIKFQEKADVVVNFEVIEHLFDPLSFLKSCSNLLNKGGYLMLTCPNIAGFETQMLKKESETVDHEHLNYFNPSSIGRLAERAGLEIVKVLTPGVLDTDIVFQRLTDETKPALDLEPFVEKLLRSSESTRQSFQEFLTQNSLSSNMMLICKKSR